MLWTGLVWLRIGLGNKHSGSIKCWETTEWLHNLWPLEWYSASQISLVSYHSNGVMMSPNTAFWNKELNCKECQVRSSILMQDEI
jgi:hypothetical protein